MSSEACRNVEDGEVDSYKLYELEGTSSYLHHRPRRVPALSDCLILLDSRLGKVRLHFLCWFQWIRVAYMTSTRINIATLSSVHAAREMNSFGMGNWD
jgi:hypothetical protein